MKKIIIPIIIILIIIISLIFIFNKSNTPVKIDKIEIKTGKENNPIIKFNITNKSDKQDLENGIINIDFYNNKELIYTLDYKLKKIEKSKTITIETTAAFEYEKITNYVIKYNNKEILKKKYLFENK